MLFFNSFDGFFLEYLEPWMSSAGNTSDGKMWELWVTNDGKYQDGKAI